MAEKFNIAKKWWFWVIIGVVVVGTIGIVAGTSKTSSGTTNKTENKTYGLNETVTVNDLVFKIESVYDTKQVGSQYVGESTENNFAVVTFEVKNLANSEKTVMSENFKYYRGSSVYEASSAGIYLDEGFYVLKEIGSGLSKKFSVVYEIPTSHESSDYILVKDSYKTEKIFLK